MERIELEIAIEKLIEHVKPQKETIKLPLDQALNHHLAKDFHAPINVPTFNRSAMDGYAVKSSLTTGATKEFPIKLKVITVILAGTDQEETIDNNHAIRIMTGAAIPDGFDAVIRQEDTNCGNAEVAIYAEVTPYTNYIKIGEDVEKGTLLIKKSTQLTPIHLGILASLGISEIEVLKPLKVGIISSGNELVEVNQPLQAGQIYDSNRYVLAAKLKELNVDVVFTKQIADDIDAACNEIKRHIRGIDMLITTGGVSVGVKDIMHDVIRQLRAQRLFWRVNMRPGTPVLASLYQNKPILSLSGNPFAALTTFELLFRPMLSAFTQTETYTCKWKKAMLMNDFNKPTKQRRFVRAYYEDGAVFLTTSLHTSSVLSSMIGCNCFIDIPAEAKPLKKGEEVQIVLI